MEENKKEVMGDITEQVDNIITELWVSSSKAITVGDFRTAFNNLQNIFMAINPYEFPLKKDIENFTGKMQELFNEMDSLQKGTEKAKINYAKINNEINNNIREYSNLITQALASLGKWLRVYKGIDDIHIKFSKETYGVEKSLLDDEIKVLSKLDKDEIFKLFDKNSIHNAYNRGLINGIKS